MKKIFLCLINFYRKNISSLKMYPTCRFYPSCSAYAYEAIERFGAFKGLYLAVKRFFKCNPFFPGGFDPVPQEFSFFSKKKNKK
ncbi:MAG: membrane protein insertion efficiency factor YidD [Oscillospiraceae bacterium]|nr:membrane protein insertion efficiency factor YidD [Oscillospiraceae bacterium]